ncbi:MULTISPECIES: helix-turn-helix domain-containing protein [Actinomycetes]|uniref:Helix-turn-helix n=3 Tax=Actinomycetes TaxID=1760 RepID=A0A2H1K0I6_BRELN|nr:MULTISPECIES: helix-turn-helix transcriptional regulator [Actinomycetes]MDN5716639.1 helix-turn-helix domain-containing protein [Janibacter sp.]MDN6134201.1 helix-turn-helix domain-containing protein [Brevibacterium sp.]AZU00428.1 XRE family transcriptional regulator [Brevibacterium linens]KAB1947268.1 helix-turn-helix transcriptional regulator [Brevibacterium linens ATCC 9172]MDN5799739.1 helix-turn-helix domain-containing protein [Corynebacterium casei]
MKESLKHRLGRNLRALRVSRGLTQEKLAEDLDVTPRYLAGIERGERNLTLDSIDALAEALRVDSVALLTVGVDASTTTQRL